MRREDARIFTKSLMNITFSVDAHVVERARRAAQAIGIKSQSPLHT
jgi:hypothetical protein